MSFGKARIETNHGKPMLPDTIVYNQRRPLASSAPPVGDCSAWRLARQRWLRTLLRRAQR